jgi:viroplasmin and RNaseH domain-containing protein
MADRWYAVVMGRLPSDAGVYQGYATVAPLVIGASGAVYRGGFKTKVEVELYLASLMAIPEITTPSLKQKWYVIAIGKNPSNRGVYDNWPEVAPKVMGVSGTPP